jgi:hypothetical protein
VPSRPWIATRPGPPPKLISVFERIVSGSAHPADAASMDPSAAMNGAAGAVGAGARTAQRAVKRHGMRLMPWMKFPTSSSGSPTSMSGSVVSNSVKIERSCRRASEAPRQ